MNADPGAKRDGPRKKEEGEEARSTVQEDIPLCDLCGHPMLERHCKLICLQCGYQRDCSDP